MNIAQAKCIPLAQYLERQGFKPEKTRQGGRELWYRSPIRSGDEHPSFKVDTIKNLWFDHGIAHGGNIIDLVREMCACDVRDALRHLEHTRLYSPALPSPVGGSVSLHARGTARRSEGVVNLSLAEGEKEKTGAFELVSESPLEHPALLQYLESRAIPPEVARRYVSQIAYKAPQSAKSYFSLGYPAGEGFEARSGLFKGFVGIGKSVSFHDLPGATGLQVFEGSMDFLSYLSKDVPNAQADAVLVLNSTNLWSRALPFVNDPRFERVRFYLDNDAAGDRATRKLLGAVDDPTRLFDMRNHYAPHKDLNDWLVATRV